MTTTTTSAPSVSAPALTYRERWQMIGGERWYIVVRWLILLAVAAIEYLVFEQQPWPVSLESDPVVLLLYAYAAFCLIMTLLMLIPPLHAVLSASYFIDVLVISLLILAHGMPGMIYLPLYVLPVLSISISFGGMVGSLSGVFCVLLYVAALVVGRHLASDDPISMEFEPLEYVRLGLYGLMLIMVPWVVEYLAIQRGEMNKRSVALARAEVERAHQEVQAIRGQMYALFEVAFTLTTTMKGEQVLEALFREGQKIVSYTAGMALLPTKNRGELAVAVGHGLNLADMGGVIQVNQGSRIASALYPPADPQVINDISGEPEVNALATLQGCRAACLIPLRVAVQVYGLVLFVRHTSTPFTSDEINTLVSLSSYATVALLNQELSIEVKKERVVLATAEDHARHWLAREIHDNLAQKLAAITMNIDYLKRLVHEDPEGSVKELDKVGELFKRANFDVRTLLGELKPTTLETQGLPAALEEYLKRMRTRYEHIQILFEAKGVSGMTLNNEAKSTLFNIVQESLNNALKYAEPKHIWVRLERAGYRFTITIQDDGKGFNVEESKARAKARGSYGLSNLEDRARLIDGATEIVSAPGKGSTIRVTVPLEV